MVKRYLDANGPVIERNNGPYVRYEDYAALEAELKEVRSLLNDALAAVQDCHDLHAPKIRVVV